MTMTRALTRCCLLAVDDASADAGSGRYAILRLREDARQRHLPDHRTRTSTRTYRVFVPSGYKPGIAYPVVIVFHGWGGNENEFLGDRNVTTLADQRGYIVVAPRGLGSGAPDANRNSWSFRGSTTGLAGPSENGASYTPGTAAGAICDPARTPNYTYPSCKNVARNTCSWTQCQADDVALHTQRWLPRSNPGYASIPHQSLCLGRLERRDVYLGIGPECAQVRQFSGQSHR